VKKRFFLLLVLAVLLAASFCPQAVLAAETYELLPRRAFWRGTSHGGSYVMVEEDLDSFLFYSSGKEGKPHTQVLYEAPVTVKAEGNSLVYHVKVLRGSCRIELLTQGAEGETLTLPWESDMAAGTHKGAIPLEELTKNDSLTFLGIRVHTIEGGKAEILALDVMARGEVPPYIFEEESSEEPSLPEESSEEEESVAPPSEEETFDPERSRDAVFVSREEVEFTPMENAITLVLMTTVSLLALFLTAMIGISLYRRTRLD